MPKTIQSLKKKMKIKLNNKFYKKEAIDEAINSFRGVCQFRVINDSFEIEVKSKGSNAENIELEFLNFALGFMKEKLLF